MCEIIIEYKEQGADRYGNLFLDGFELWDDYYVQVRFKYNFFSIFSLFFIFQIENMACTVEQQTWSPHRLAGSPYVPRGLSPNRSTSRGYALQNSRRSSAPEEHHRSIRDSPDYHELSCQSCGEDSIVVKPHRVDKIGAPPSILKIRTTPPTKRRSKHIGFKNEALVHHLGDLGEYLYTNLENVNFEPKPQNLCHRLVKLAKLQKCALQDSTNKQNAMFSDDMSLKARSSSANQDTTVLTRGATSSDKDTTISFARDACGNLTMHLSVYVGKEHNPKDVLVKACTSGRKLRVLSGTTNRESHVTPFMKDISLPMEIESLSIRAKMDPKGFLAIEGNVKDMTSKGSPH